MLPVEVLKALANERRLQILQWLRDPVAHFPAQLDGDLVDDGVCSALIAQKLGVGAPTASEHLRILVRSGLLTSVRIKQWTFYRRNEEHIAQLRESFAADW